MSMDILTIATGCALYSSENIPDYLYECLLLKSVMFLALLWFCHRRFSSTCLRIYRVDPGPSFYAVFPRFFLPKRTVPFQSGDVKLKDGIFYIAGKKVYTGGRFFKSYYHIEEMLNL